MLGHDQWTILVRHGVMREIKHINYHIYLSLWRIMKGSFDEVIENSRWLFGNGRSIKLWLDKWNGSSAVDSLGINDWNQDVINDRVSDYIYNWEWRVPQSILMKFPSLTNLFSNVHIPIKEKEYACI